MKIYVASSWRNEIQPEVVRALRAAGHDVYDFKNPRPGDHGFDWAEIDPDWKDWTPGLFVESLQHPIAEAGFSSDMNALAGCEVCVLVMPCNRSAHLEAGWAAGAGKEVFILIPEKCEPELMYKMTDGQCENIEQLIEAIAAIEPKDDLIKQNNELQKTFVLACRILSDFDCPSIMMGTGWTECSGEYGSCGDRDQWECWQKYFVERVRSELVCRICGCTQNNACQGGCYWVEEDLCSSCVDKAAEAERKSLIVSLADVMESVGSFMCGDEISEEDLWDDQWARDAVAVIASTIRHLTLNDAG